jgi:hypothetical protein
VGLYHEAWLALLVVTGLNKSMIGRLKKEAEINDGNRTCVYYVSNDDSGGCTGILFSKSQGQKWIPTLI